MIKKPAAAPSISENPDRTIANANIFIRAKIIMAHGNERIRNHIRDSSTVHSARHGQHRLVL
jgi:hypothetical protein